MKNENNDVQFNKSDHIGIVKELIKQDGMYKHIRNTAVIIDDKTGIEYKHPRYATEPAMNEGDVVRFTLTQEKGETIIDDIKIDFIETKKRYTD